MVGRIAAVEVGKKRDGSDEPSGLTVANPEFDNETLQAAALRRRPTPAASLLMRF